MKIKKQSRKAFYRILRFGFPVTFFDYLFEITKIKCINSIKHNLISNWLKRDFEYFISMHYDKANISPKGSIPSQIWLCWWDGIDTMPPIVKACYNSVLENAPGFQITLITKFNYFDYISFPEHIIEKVNSKKMTLTHFSNLIRMALLYKHGGLWMDATFLVTGKINLDMGSFFTINGNYNWTNIAKGRWSGNFIAGAANYYLFNLIFEFLSEYWKKYDYLITHHLYDYTINLAYESFPMVKKAFDAVPVTKKNNILINNIKNEFNDSIYKNAVENSAFHKLSWKRVGPTHTPDDKLTFYGYILDKYKSYSKEP